MARWWLARRQRATLVLLGTVFVWLLNLLAPRRVGGDGSALPAFASSALGGGSKGSAAQAAPSELVYAEGGVVDTEDPEAWKHGKVVWFTILNKPRYFWCQMLGSAYHNKITMNIWGWGNDKFTGWLETWLKIPLGIEFMSGLDDEHVGFVDGADSLFQTGVDGQLAALVSLQKDGKYNFAMSSEINCAVQSLARHGCDNERFPLTPWGRRYLNSGLYMGRAKYVREMLEFVEKYYLPRFAEGTVQRNDQSVIGLAWHDGWRKNFTIDAYTELFQSVRMAEKHYCNDGDPNHPVPQPNGLLKNCLTNNTPSIFHFNGKAKPFLEKWQKHFWWYGRTIDRRAVVFVNKKPRRLQEMCPKLAYH